MILDAEYWACGRWRWMNAENSELKAQSRAAEQGIRLNDFNEEN
jgi:hypothetical protein